jgi:hypothetical protein
VSLILEAAIVSLNRLERGKYSGLIVPDKTNCPVELKGNVLGLLAKQRSPSRLLEAPVKKHALRNHF